MRKIKLLIIPLVVCCLLLIVFLSWFFWATGAVCRADCQTKSFVVEKGESLGKIAERLEKEGLIRSSLAFQFLATFKGLTQKIQAGEFRLNPQDSSLVLLLNLTRGGSLDIRVTIIEGLRREEIAEKLATSGLGNFNKEEFLQITKGQEGRLFPDTYFFSKEATSQDILEILLKNFSKKMPMPTKEVLMMASIIEREVRENKDRAIVAGILLKRLQNDWPLQADATVQYAVASAKCSARGGVNSAQSAKCEWWPKNLTKEDLAVKSPYNTYLNKGLPPGPICNPGLSAIEAVLNPTQTDYWFYITDLQGVMHYAKTAEEHAQNVQKYLLQDMR